MFGLAAARGIMRRMRACRQHRRAIHRSLAKRRLRAIELPLLWWRAVPRAIFEQVRTRPADTCGIADTFRIIEHEPRHSHDAARIRRTSLLRRGPVPVG